MNEYMLKIVTPDNLVFMDNVHKFVADTTDGRIGILAGHIDYFTTITLGRCEVTTNEDAERIGICNTGILTVLGGTVTLIATTFEWIEDIDKYRAIQAKEKTIQLLKNENLPEEERLRLEQKLKRAELRNKYV